LIGGARVAARASSCRRDFSAEKLKFNRTDGMALPHIRGLPGSFLSSVESKTQETRMRLLANSA
jgi:hypothetical protein